MAKAKQFVLLTDLHYPVHSPEAWAAVIDYLKRNPPDGIILMGDFLDMNEVSHHTIGKPLHRPQGALAANLKGFKEEILDPLDKVLPKKATKVWIHGNHERFLIADLIETNPELDGMLDLDEHLGLTRRGYKVIPQGGFYKLGHLHIIHGDTVGGGQNPAKKAVDVWGTNVVLGHHHTLQQFTRSSPAHESKRWTGTVLPCLSNTNPTYGRSRANSWVLGFGILSLRPDDTFNLFVVVITDGTFSTPDGRVYGKGPA